MDGFDTVSVHALLRSCQELIGLYETKPADQDIPENSISETRENMSVALVKIQELETLKLEGNDAKAVTLTRQLYDDLDQRLKKIEEKYA